MLCERSSGQCYNDLRQQSVYQSALVHQIHQIVNMVSGTDHPDCNSVEDLLQNSFERLSVSEEIVCLCLFCWPCPPLRSWLLVLRINKALFFSTEFFHNSQHFNQYSNTTYTMLFCFPCSFSMYCICLCIHVLYDQQSYKAHSLPQSQKFPQKYILNRSRPA